MPDASTIAALLAVSAVPRRLVAEAPPVTGNDCCLRNHPDRDTVPPSQCHSQLDKSLETATTQADEHDHDDSSSNTTDAFAREMVADTSRSCSPTGAGGREPAGCCREHSCDHIDVSGLASINASLQARRRPEHGPAGTAPVPGRRGRRAGLGHAGRRLPGGARRLRGRPEGRPALGRAS
jgi:hypothetical protein